MDRLRLRELILKKYKAQLKTYGLLFAQIGRDGTFTWLDEQDGKTLDYMYFLQHSGLKDVYVFDKLFEYIETICDLETLCDEDIICGFVNDTLELVKNMVVLKYKTKWNRLFNLMNSDINSLTTDSYSVTETPQLQVQVSNNGNVDTYGFNSQNPVPQSKGDSLQTTSQTGQRTITYKGLKGGNYPESVAKEIELMKWNFFEQMMEDVDTIITLPKYTY